MNRLSLSILLYSLVVVGALGAQPLFERLSSDATGVDFNNVVTDEQEHSILIYSNYYGGAGVGIGDFNNDGLQDLFFAGNLAADRLYLNQGDMQFSDATEAAGILDDGGWSSGVVLADVNNDGWLDIYVTRELYDDQPDKRRNLLYINRQDGTFSEESARYGIDNRERTRHATFLDYDQDGHLDLFLLNQPPNPGNYSDYYGADLKRPEWAPRLYRNTGQGRFTDVTEAAGLLTPGYPNSVVAADVNNDGWTDLYVANDYDAPDWLYLNQGDGTFVNVLPQQFPHTSYYSMGVDIADIDNDGNLDIMTLDMVAEDNYRLKANMGGMYPEAFWKVVDQGGHYQYMFNALHRNNGNGTFSDIAQLAGVSNTDWSWANLIADFDNDGHKDIFVTNGLLRDIRNSDAAKELPKYVQQVIEDFIAENPNAGEVHIFDILDVKKALELVPSQPLSNYAYRNNGDLTFDKVSREWGLDAETFSNGAAYGDLDNDGDLDLVVNNINAPAGIYRNHTSERGLGNALRIRLRKEQAPVFGARVYLMEAGRRTQLVEAANVRGMYSTSEPLLHIGVGQLQRADVLVRWPDGTEDYRTDLPVNRLVEIDYADRTPGLPRTAAPAALFSAKAESAFQHRENDFDDYAKQVLLPHKQSQFGPALAAGDADGDGWDELYVGGAAGQAGQLFRQDNNGNLQPWANNLPAEDAAYEDVAATFFDADGDGDLDLYVVSGGNEHAPQSKMYQDRLYFNEGGGNWRKATDELPLFRESGGTVVAWDYDGDGDQDLFVGGRHQPWSYPSPAISRLLRNDGGRFTDVTKTHAPDLIYLGMVTDAVWTDFNRDGQPDLLVVGEWMAPTLFLNEAGTLRKTTPTVIDGATGRPMDATGWWYAAHARDIDGDGDEDYVLGNLGQNYKYRADQEQPFEVYYEDFDDNGSKDIVLSYYNFGERYPLRGRSCSSEQIPELKQKFPTYDVFAAAPLERIFDPAELDESLHYAARTFASAYLENTGDGRLIFRPLPNLAQVSSINAILSDDYDGDGHLDLLIAGNLYPAEIETPRNDAGIGLLLTGDGKGNFSPMAAESSGVSLPYDVKRAVQLSGPQGTTLWFAVNNGPLVRLNARPATRR